MKALVSIFLLLVFHSLLGSQPKMQDSLALVALYNSTNGDDWRVNTNWLSNESIDTWYGISVAERRVTRIDLYSNNLKGHLPSELGNLSNLQFLYLFSNQLIGGIPIELGNLINLKELDISHNELNGNIPLELRNLSNLTHLCLGYNNLEGIIPAELSNLNKLELLYLNFNNLNGHIPLELGKLKNLKGLYLAVNQLSGVIPVELGNLSNIEYLHLSNNKFIGSIPDELANLNKLRSLLLEDNQLSGNIPAVLGGLDSLEFLSLGNNQLKGNIPSELGNLKSLRALELYNNQLSGNIPVELGTLENLEFLILDDNQISGSVIEELNNLTNLRVLSLRNNYFSGGIPLSIKNLNNLESFVIENNELSDLPDLSNMSNLNKLWIQNNCFTFEDIEPNITVPSFKYCPQDSYGIAIDTTVALGEEFVLSGTVGGTHNEYRWLKDGSVIIGWQTASHFGIVSMTEAFIGTYYCEVKNTIAKDLILYRRPIKLSALSNIPSNENYVIKYYLHQNYPNPFNPCTTIEFDIPKTSEVTLKIYNIVGEEVATLVSDRLSAGSYSYEWDASNTASGVYLYRLEADDFVETRKMALMR